jgi:hypothetical protein
VVEVMVGGMEEATEEVVGAIMGDTLTAMAMAMAITGDMDMDMVGGVILTGGVPLITIPTTILITMGPMGGCRCFHKRLLLRQNRDNSNFLIGTSARTQRVTTPTLKIARVVG